MALEREVRRPAIRPILIRAAVEADLPRVAEIKVHNWADTYGPLIDPAVLAPLLDQDEHLGQLRAAAPKSSTLLLVAEDATKGVVGFALTYLGTERDDPWLESLHVIRDSRGAGAGTALMRATVAELLARGYHTLRLGVVQGNSEAGRFYARLGARMVGHEPADWADGVWHEIYRWDDITAIA